MMRPTRFAALRCLLAAVAMAVGPALAMAQNDEAAAFEVVAELDVSPGNPAVTPDGRLLFSVHPFANSDYRVMELVDGKPVPFPNEDWATAPDDGGVGLHRIIGIECDPNGIVWMLDMGPAEVGDDASAAAKLVGWDVQRNRLHRVIHITKPVYRDGSFMQDLAVDITRDRIYIADMGGGDVPPAIVVVDLTTGQSRRVLTNAKPLRAEPVAITIGEKTLTPTDDGKPAATLALNPIVIDPDYRWVYFAAMQGETVYRIEAGRLAQMNATDNQLAASIQTYGKKAASDGIGIDKAGNVYVTDLPADGIGVTRPDGSYELLFSDPKLSWTDGMSFGPDGYYYVTVNQLHLHPALNDGKDETKPPFLLIRFKPLEESRVGR